MGYKKYNTLKKHILTIEETLRLKFGAEGEGTKEIGEFKHKTSSWKKSAR